ncbi:PepSY domain-containing protein [Virgibacillus ihumii]|uniref:PepSY domain-containing protein n=1 Tax=Virgibacillus ihumii TaxID=2686091 RepID=UPI001FE2DBBD|nr:PepSY domain-containing protein [Virgibacillus ihumii]
MFRQRLTMQQAQDIALQRIPGQVLHVDMDLEHGVLVYEIFILTSQNRVYEVEVNANSGNVIKVEQEDLD